MKNCLILNHSTGALGANPYKNEEIDASGLSMWIEVTAVSNNHKFAVNFDHVLQISPFAQGTLLMRVGNERVQILERYD
jgi:hypothetical protein